MQNQGSNLALCSNFGKKRLLQYLGKIHAIEEARSFSHDGMVKVFSLLLYLCNCQGTSLLDMERSNPAFSMRLIPKASAEAHAGGVHWTGAARPDKL